MAFPTFTDGQALPASDLNAIGLWLVKTQTIGNAVSSVTVSSAFSTTYDNYLITVTNATMSVDTNFSMSLGSTATGYYGFLVYGSYAGSAVSGAGNNNTAFWSWAGGGSNCTAHIELKQPYLNLGTQIRSWIRYGTVYGQYVGLLDNTTSYTAFTITPASGTMTGGTISVYGYRK